MPPTSEAAPAKGGIGTDFFVSFVISIGPKSTAFSFCVKLKPPQAKPTIPKSMSTIPIPFNMALFTSFDAKFICHLEHPVHALRAQAGDIFIHLSGDNTDQSNVPVLDDDVDRRDGLQPVAI